MVQTGFPWLAFTIEFPDRTLDLVGGREDEVQQWFLGVQALAPLSVHHLTIGGVLWQRLIMKLNFYGLVTTLRTHSSTHLPLHIPRPSSAHCVPLSVSLSGADQD